MMTAFKVSTFHFFGKLPKPDLLPDGSKTWPVWNHNHSKIVVARLVNHCLPEMGGWSGIRNAVAVVQKKQDKSAELKRRKFVETKYRMDRLDEWFRANTTTNLSTWLETRKKTDSLKEFMKECITPKWCVELIHIEILEDIARETAVKDKYLELFGVDLPGSWYASCLRFNRFHLLDGPFDACAEAQNVHQRALMTEEHERRNAAIRANVARRLADEREALEEELRQARRRRVA